MLVVWRTDLGKPLQGFGDSLSDQLEARRHSLSGHLALRDALALEAIWAPSPVEMTTGRCERHHAAPPSPRHPPEPGCEPVDAGRTPVVSPIIWHLLPDTYYRHLGAEHFDRHVTTEHKKRTHIGQLEALSYRVILEPAA